MSMRRVYLLYYYIILYNIIYIITPFERKGIRFLFRNPAAEPFQ